MEGIPRVPMVAPEMKVPSQQFPEQLRPNINEYIAMHYQDDPHKYESAMDELEQMRTMLSRCHADVESICVAKRYYAQLAMMKRRFPMEEHDPIAVPFAWTDRTLDLMNQLVYEDVNFEMCCIMFNIGAAHAQIAANETRTEMDSIKNAFMHFQWAAWPFEYLRDQMGAARYSTGDFETPYINFYLNILLAQAQECMLEKSMIDHRKPVVISKVAVQLHKMYRKCEADLKTSGIADVLSSSKYRELERLCSAKAHLYGAIANYYLGQHADDEKQPGTRLFYFARALELVKQAQQVSDRDKPKGLRTAVQFAYDVIFQREANARKENDFVYHERIPREDELPRHEGVSMVKPIGFDPCDPSIAGEDLFQALLPTDVVKAISMYSEAKNQFRRELLDRVVEKDTQLENYLLSMKLDQLALDQPADQFRLPDELLAASAAFTAQPDLFPDLLDNFQKVTDLAMEAEKKLAELKHRIRNITNPFFTNDEAYIAIAKKLDELGKHHSQARENNAELQRAMALHSENLKMLSMPLPELIKQICGNFTDPGNSREGQHLRKVIDKVDEMRRQRCQLVDRLREDLDADDITKRALTERGLDSDKLFETELKKHSQSKEVIEQNLRAQDNIMKALTDANACFADSRRQILASNEKRALHSMTLVTAYQVFMDVVGKTKSALDFYSQLVKLLAQLERGVKNIEEYNDQSLKEEAQKRQAEEEKRRRELAMQEEKRRKELALLEERRRKEEAAREERRRKEEAAREADRAVNEFRFV